LGVVGVVVAIVTGIGGLILGFLGWRRSGKAIAETMRTRVRDEQHTLIAGLADPADELSKLLEELNADVQHQPADTTVLREKAERIRVLVGDMGRTVIVDPALSEAIAELSSKALPPGPDANDIPRALEEFADLWDRVAEAKAKPDSQPARDELFNLGAGFGHKMEPLRRRCNDLRPIVEKIRERVQDIGRYGLGDFPAKPRKPQDR
jgi:hypothetical protein